MTWIASNVKEAFSLHAAPSLQKRPSNGTYRKLITAALMAAFFATGWLQH
jgi:hypothetical protein